MHVTTARRWKRGDDPPHSASVLVELRSTGNLGVVFAEWDNWRIVNGALISPDQQTFTRNDILSLPFVRMQVAHFKVEARLPRQSDWVDQRWAAAPEYESEVG